MIIKFFFFVLLIFFLFSCFWLGLLLTIVRIPSLLPLFNIKVKQKEKKYYIKQLVNQL